MRYIVPVVYSTADYAVFYFAKCKVKNTSAYTFLPGDANIFMNNNFVSKSRISVRIFHLPSTPIHKYPNASSFPLQNVSPHESFSCSLGTDPSLRVTYPPLSKKTHTPTGSLLGAKTISTFHSQRITLKNTRRHPITRLVVRDLIPISSDARIKINVNEPAGLPEIGLAGAGREVAVGPNGTTGKDIKARWVPVGEEDGEGSGEPNDEGILEWICRVEAGASVDLTLNWEVNVPKDLKWKAL